MAIQLKVGEKAPNFTLMSHKGEAVALEHFRGKKNVILYFYPKDDTPGCTKEACSFRDNFRSLGTLDAEILGVSVDNVESHTKFADKFFLPFHLLSDQKGEVSKLYGVLNEQGYDNRVTFIIDKSGTVRHIFPEVRPEEHAVEVQKVLEGVKVSNP